MPEKITIDVGHGVELRIHRTATGNIVLTASARHSPASATHEQTILRPVDAARLSEALDNLLAEGGSEEEAR